MTDNDPDGDLLQYNEISWHNELISDKQIRDHLQVVSGNLYTHVFKILTSLGYFHPSSPVVCVHSTNGVETLKIRGIVTTGDRRDESNHCYAPIDQRIAILTNLERFEKRIREIIN